MPTSRSASICAGWAPASHQTTWSRMVSSLRKARSRPSRVPSTGYTSSRARRRPSAPSPDSRAASAAFPSAGKALQIEEVLDGGGLFPRESVRVVGVHVEKKTVPTPHSVSVSGAKSSAGALPSAPGGSRSAGIGSSSPSSQPRTASNSSRFTTSQWTRPVSTCAESARARGVVLHADHASALGPERRQISPLRRGRWRRPTRRRSAGIRFRRSRRSRRALRGGRRTPARPPAAETGRRALRGPGTAPLMFLRSRLRGRAPGSRWASSRSAPGRPGAPRRGRRCWGS